MQHRDERLVNLEGDDALEALRQLGRQTADAGADLHDHAVPVVAAGVGDALGDRRIDEKILPEAFLCSGAERRQDIPDGAYVT